jgi:hypothetical protein
MSSRNIQKPAYSTLQAEYSISACRLNVTVKVSRLLNVDIIMFTETAYRKA